MKTVSCALLVGSGFAGVANVAHADEGELTGNVTLTTDYVWRGISQSNEDWAIQGGFDYANGPFYVGTWASNVDFEDTSDTNIELDIYGGLAGEFEGGISWDVGAIAYFYPDADDEDLDFIEVYGGLGYDFSGVGVGGYVYIDPDNENIYLEGSAGYGFTDAISADVSLGNYSFDEGEDYTNWSIGGTYSAPFGVDFDLRYWGTDVDDTDIADDRVVLSVSRGM
ncbi:MAG: TorF family putative porin [Pseudomonadota bacterium]